MTIEIKHKKDALENESQIITFEYKATQIEYKTLTGKSILASLKVVSSILIPFAGFFSQLIVEQVCINSGVTIVKKALNLNNDFVSIKDKEIQIDILKATSEVKINIPEPLKKSNFLKISNN